MNIQTVANNLRKTIAGKEMMLTTLQNPSVKAYPKIVKESMVHMLETNIDELKRILQDVKQCQEVDLYQEGREAGYEEAILKERG